MVHIIPKWKVTVSFPEREVVVWFSDNYIMNVLRTVAMMDFSNGPVQPFRIKVEEEGR